MSEEIMVNILLQWPALAVALWVMNHDRANSQALFDAHKEANQLLIANYQTQAEKQMLLIEKLCLPPCPE